MDSKIWQILFDGVRTLEEAYLLDDELKLVEQASFRNEAQGNNDVLSKARQVISYKTYAKLESLSEKGLVHFDNPQELRLFFDAAHKQILRTPRLQLQLAIEANDHLLNALYAWVKREIHEVIFLELITKPALLAGCVLVYQGIYRDYSLRSKLETDPAAIFGPIMAKVGEHS